MNSNTKDWTGNKNSIFKTLGASNHTEKVREVNDYYATDPIAIDVLIRDGGVKFDKPIWEVSCVDCDTEYYNGAEWKKISTYTQDDKVLCFDGKNGILLTPEKYHKYEYNGDFYYYKSKELDMMLTPEHRVVYHHRRNNNLEIKTAKEIFDMYDRDSNGFRGKIPTTFTLKQDDNLSNINEWELRLAVACNADGRNKTKYKNTYQIRVKKERKKERLEFLLNKCNINFKYKIYDGYYDFTFISPLGCKLFPKEWIFLPDKLKEAFLDEIYRWDGSCANNVRTYFSSKKSDIDTVQMIAHSLGVHAKIDIDQRKNNKNYQTSYRITFKNKTKHSLVKKQYHHLNIEKSKDLHKYCFTVKTGMLILRRNNKIFITGNCGSGHLSERLKSYGCEVYSTDLIDRGYGVGGIDFLTVTDKWNGDILTNPPYSISYKFVEHAMELLEEGNRCFMFLKVQFLEGKARKELFKKYPPKCVYVSSSRILCAKNGDFEGMKAGGGSAVAYAWFEWEKGYNGETVLKWIN